MTKNIETANEPKPRRDWDLIDKKVSVFQSLFLIVSALVGCWWVYMEFRADGRGISGSSISITAQQLVGETEPFLISVAVDITGSDRRGYYYDFRHAYLSVIKVTPSEPGKLPKLMAVSRSKPEVLDLTEKGEIVGFISERSHISSYRSGGFTFLVPVKEPGVYLVTFAMPSSGVLSGSHAALPEGNTPETNVLGVFSGESEAVYVSVKDPAG